MKTLLLPVFLLVSALQGQSQTNTLTVPVPMTAAQKAVLIHLAEQSGWTNSLESFAASIITAKIGWEEPRYRAATAAALSPEKLAVMERLKEADTAQVAAAAAALPAAKEKEFKPKTDTKAK